MNSSADAVPVLADRIATLDSEPLYVDRHAEWDTDVAHFIRTMQVVTRPGTVDDARRLPGTSPAVADEMAAGCRLLHRLADKAPDAVDGPLARTHQYWVATGRPERLPPRPPRFDRAHFVDAAAEGPPATGQAHRLGLYTCSGTLGPYGMWWTFLQVNRGSTLFPPPWRVWSVDVREDARVLEITTAADWVDFVATHATTLGDVVYPDWTRAAEHWDAVHMTLRAIVATQGIWFPLGRRLAGAPFWDVESTRWLSWVFSDAALVEELKGA